ncbi:RPA-interacting protein alpha [Anticarsia gemmatalis]|uniref:RPA-interacting protein alpha n=1 Tax=Anticarsia gemmatalis TaxID=129554 RepID=UPI003F770DFB
MTSSPKYKNLGLRPKQSPIELKEKMRKNYKNKVQNCRGMLMDKLRGNLTETDLCNTLTNIYKNMFRPDELIDDEELEIMDEIRHELVQEELEWWVKEYEQCQMVNVDWSSIEESNDVICPVCQKSNLQLSNGYIRCIFCNISIATDKSLLDIKKNILLMVDNHNSFCNSDVQFGIFTETNETQVCLICESCRNVKSVIP